MANRKTSSAHRDSAHESLRPGDSQQQVRKIVAVSAALFRERGFVGTTTQEIADAAGVVKATLFYHIGSKEELLSMIIFELLDEGITSWRSVIAEHADSLAPDTIRAMVLEHCRIVSERRDAVAAFSDELRHLTPDRMERVANDWATYRGMLEDVVTRGVQRGDLWPTDPHVLTLAVLTMLNNIYRWYSPEGPRSSEEIANIISEILLSGLAANHAPRE